MKMLSPTIFLAGVLLLLPNGLRADELAAFRIPDSNRSFLFNEREASGLPSTSPAGIRTILAKRFTVAQSSNVVEITYYDAVMCRASIGSKDLSHTVVSMDRCTTRYPVETRVLVRGRFLRLADLSEESFDAPQGSHDTSGKGDPGKN